MNRKEMIEFLFNVLYRDDDPKRDGSNIAYLETFTDEELEDKVFDVKFDAKIDGREI